MHLHRKTFLGGLAALGALSLQHRDAVAADARPEKTKLRIGFLPISCATPIIMAEPLGFYAKYGLDVELVKLPGWAAVRDKALAGELDAFHMLSPMPLSISLGLGSPMVPIKLASIENVNGQAITLGKKLLGKVKGPKDFRGLTIGIPFDYSMHNLLLRYYLAGGGVNPDRDVKLVIVTPPDMVAKLAIGDLDGFFGPEPTNQRAVFEGAGFLHMLSKELWDGHPCCAFAATGAWAAANPVTFRLVNRAIVDAAHFAHEQGNRKKIAEAIAPSAYLNQPEPVIEAVMTGSFEDGTGATRHVPDRMDFLPYPWHTYSYWILTQFQRWGYLKGEVDYERVSNAVFLTDVARELGRAVGFANTDSDFKTVRLKYDTFNPREAAAYLARQRHLAAV